MLQPYLTKHQTDKSMLPFLGKDLERMHRVQLQLFVKLNVLDKCVYVNDLLRISIFIAGTYLKLKLRYFGFSTEEQLKNLLHQDKITSADVRNQEGGQQFGCCHCGKNHRENSIVFQRG